MFTSQPIEKMQQSKNRPVFYKMDIREMRAKHPNFPSRKTIIEIRQFPVGLLFVFFHNYIEMEIRWHRILGMCARNLEQQSVENNCSFGRETKVWVSHKWFGAKNVQNSAKMAPKST